MNKPMPSGIFSGGITLAATVLLAHLFTWHTTKDLGAAQTYAFVTWLLCHVCLAFNMRTNRVPLSKVGIFSSKAFNFWMVGVAAFLLLVLNLPVLNHYLKLSPVDFLPVLILAGLSILTMSWMEIRKHIM